MPISPAYEWSETPTTLTITAQCRGANAASTDVFSSPHYVSVNASPYYLELDLHGAIDSTRSVLQFRQNVVTLRLTKALEAKWGRLVVDLPRDQRLKRREASRELAAQEAQAALERKKRAVWDDSRFSLGKQMDKDRANRANIDTLKAQELESEAADLEQFSAQINSSAEGRKSLPEGRKSLPLAPPLPPPSSQAKQKSGARSKKGLIEDVSDDFSRIVDITEEVPPLAEQGDSIFDQPIFDEDDGEEEAAATGSGEPSVPAQSAASTTLVKPPPPAAALPPVRSTGKIKVGFTKQLLTAPARTKTDNAEYDLPLDPLAAPGLFQSKGGGDISQRDPAWLKDRGDRYFRMGDYRSAEEAYTMVLTQFAKSIMGQAIDCVVACWSNRAVCRLHRKAYLEAVEDCGHAILTMSKARCVTENPKSEPAHVRCRMRLLSKRAAAYAGAGVLHRALTDLRVATTMASGPMPSDAADRQMLASDVQSILERHELLMGTLTKADTLLSEVQPQVASRMGMSPGEAEAAADLPSAVKATLCEARELYTESLALAGREVSALANRAACSLYLGEPNAATLDCTAALNELDAEMNERTVQTKSEQSGMFALAVPDEANTELTRDLHSKEATLRYELLRRRAAARMAESEQFYPQAAIDLKEALKLRPADAAVVMALDTLSRRAAAANVELEPLPPAMPQAQLAMADDDDDDDDDEAAEEDEGDEVDGEAGGGAGEAGEGAGGTAPVADGSAATAGASSIKPPVGTRSASGFKADADAAFKEARLGKAITLYGKALKADNQAEWHGEGQGILFRCQCLANRSACHLKMHAFTETVNDAGAAIAALGAGVVDWPQEGENRALLLKLLARRGMAMCQLSRYDEAAVDYTRAVDLDPTNEQLKEDLKRIEAARTK